MALKLDSGEWSYDSKKILDMRGIFFEVLHTEGSDIRSLHFDRGYPIIDEGHLALVGGPITEQEIKRAPFDIGQLKLLDPTVSIHYSISLSGILWEPRWWSSKFSVSRPRNCGSYQWNTYSSNSED